jgi:hypothetical protein
MNHRITDQSEPSPRFCAPLPRGLRDDAQARSFRATLALGDRTETATAQASGPVAALTATFVRGGDGHNNQWAMGWAQDATESALFAVIACANRLLLSEPA